MAVYLIYKYSIIFFQVFIVFYLVSSQTTSPPGDVTTTPGNVTCQSNELLCNDGLKCYQTSYICDGIPDCDDGTDETNCTQLQAPCPEGLVRCPNQSCVKRAEQCSGVPINRTNSSLINDTLLPSSTISASSLDTSFSSDVSTSVTHSRTAVHLSTVLSYSDITKANYTQTISVQPTTSLSVVSPVLSDLHSSFNLKTDDSYSLTTTPLPSVTSIAKHFSDIDGKTGVTDLSYFTPTATIISVDDTAHQKVSTSYLNMTSLKSFHYTSSAEITRITSMSGEMMSSKPVQPTSSSEFISSSNKAITSVTTVQSTISSRLMTSLKTTFQSTSSVLYSQYLTQLKTSMSLSYPVFFTTSNYSVGDEISESTSRQYSSVIDTKPVVSMVSDRTPVKSSHVTIESSKYESEASFSLSTSSHVWLTSSYLDTKLMSPHHSTTSSLLTMAEESRPITSDTTTSSKIEPTPSSSKVDFYTSSLIIASTPLTSPVNTSSTVAPPTKEPLPPWLIALIVCGSVIFLYLVFLVYVLCKKRHKLTKYKMAYEDPDDIGYRRSIVKKSGHDYVSYDNRLVYEPPDTPEPNGLNSEMNNPFTFRHLRNSDFRRNSDDSIP